MYYFQREPNLAKVRLLYQYLPIFSLKDLALKGNDLMSNFDYPRGPWISTTLKKLEQEVVEGRLNNEKAVLLAYATDFLKRRMI